MKVTALPCYRRDGSAIWVNRYQTLVVHVSCAVLDFDVVVSAAPVSSDLPQQTWFLMHVSKEIHEFCVTAFCLTLVCYA